MFSYGAACFEAFLQSCHEHHHPFLLLNSRMIWVVLHGSLKSDDQSPMIIWWKNRVVARGHEHPSICLQHSRTMPCIGLETMHETADSLAENCRRNNSKHRTCTRFSKWELANFDPPHIIFAEVLPQQIEAPIKSHWPTGETSPGRGRASAGLQMAMTSKWGSPEKIEWWVMYHDSVNDVPLFS